MNARSGIVAVLTLLGANACVPPAQAPHDCAAAEKPERPGAKYVVVLGNSPPVDEDGVLRAELRQRVELGVHLFLEHDAEFLVMSGGETGRGIEAEYMKEHALRSGVPPGRVLLEGTSTSTIENAAFTRNLLCRSASCPQEIALVSNPFHVVRAATLFECAGFQVRRVTWPPGPRASDNRSHERWVGVAYAFIDECERVRELLSDGATRPAPASPASPADAATPVPAGAGAEPLP